MRLSLKKMRPDLRICLVVGFALTTLAHEAGRAWAQADANSPAAPAGEMRMSGDQAVIIDFGVLGLSPAQAAAAARRLAPAERKLEKPLLTAPAPQANRSQQIQSKPYEIKAPEGRGLVSFPVEVRERSEDYDPSLPAPPSRPAKKDARASAKSAALAAPPLPALKPVKTVRSHAADKATETEAPLPPRLPPERAAAGNAGHATATPPMVRTPAVRISDASGIPMPAVPATRVHAEKLTSDMPGLVDNGPDRLARALVVPDRQTMVKSVEEVGRLANALAPIDITEKTMNDIEPASGDTASFNRIPALPLDAAAANAQAGSVPRLPPAADETEIDYVSVPFGPGLTELDRQVTAALEGQILPLLKQNPGWRLQIQSFAGNDQGNEKSARRLSLSRALAVRTHLIDNGIDAARMDVRALGGQTDRNPADRVDFVIFDPARGAPAGN